jgi:hypothetical protein
MEEAGVLVAVQPRHDERVPNDDDRAADGDLLLELVLAAVRCVWCMYVCKDG